MHRRRAGVRCMNESGTSNRRWLFAAVAGATIVAAYSAGAQQASQLVRFKAGEPARASDVNANFEHVERLALTAAPAGTINAFAGPADKVPEGWLLADGRQLSRA